MQSLPIFKKWLFCLVVFLLALGVATPVFADYLGPNRVVTQPGSACKVVLNECKFVEAKGDYRYHQVKSWSCSNESKPWQAYPSDAPRSCSAQAVGEEYWSRDEGQPETVTYPPATISSSLQSCTLQNGWCGGTLPQLVLNANEPVAGYGIVLIEGILNGQNFACPNGMASCSVPLTEGDNNLSYWALSSWGDSSTMGISSARVDTVSPDVSLNISGANGENGWYVSPTSITATGADATSGLASALLSVNGGILQSTATLDDGVYDIAVTASDYAGNSSSSSATIFIDTTTPSVKVSVNGTIGKNGWYRSNIQVSALASDATSGLNSFEASVDGGVYQSYAAPILFTDGIHTIQLKVTDFAGNVTETSVQQFYVDTIAPGVDLPGTWQLGRNVPYRVQDAGSGLADLRIVIEDEDERFAKVAWNQSVSGAAYSQDINWNGQFKDETVAPPGTYFVWIKASDRAGHEHIQLGRVIVPETHASLGLFASDDASLETPAPPEDLSEAIDPSSATISPDFDFGGSTAEIRESTTQSFLLTTGTAGSVPSTSSNVLWGAAAAAVAGAATAFVLAEKRKREQAAAEQAALEAEEEERREKNQSQKREKMQAERVLEQSWEEAQRSYAAHIDVKVARTEAEEGAAQALKNLPLSLYKIIAKRDLRADIKDVLIEQEMNAFTAEPQDWRADYDKYMAQKALEEERKKLQESSTVSQKKPWWQKTWEGIKDGTDKAVNWVDEHQVEIALGIGVVAGITAIVLTGGLATPMVAAALIAGSALAAGTSVGIATIGLNIHYGRAWNENLGRNFLVAGGAAALTSGVVLLYNTAVITGTTYCTANPNTCTQIAPALKLFNAVSQAVDTAEGVWLTTKLGYQTWKGDEAGALQTAFDVHSEYADGGIPGNSLVKEARKHFPELNKNALDLISKHGVGLIPLVAKYGDEGLDFIRIYGREGVALLQTYGDDAFTIIHKLNPLISEDALQIVLKQSPEAIAALSHWTDAEITRYTNELVARAATDAKALEATSKLAKIKDLRSPDAEKLLKIVAQNSIQGQGNRIILGKWVDGSFDEGFIGAARSQGTRYYGPNRGLATALEGLSVEDQDKYLWAINQAALQEAVDSGWQIDYSLDGLSEQDVKREIKAIDAIVSDNDQGVIDIFERFPFRMREIKFLVSQGYTPTLDEAARTVYWSKP